MPSTNEDTYISRDSFLRMILRKPLFHLLLIAMVGLIAYSNSFSVPFVFDDDPNIVNNPVIKTLDNFTSSLKGYEYNPRRFIGYLSLALTYRFAGLDVLGYHIVNLSIHITNAILVYFLVVLTLQTPYFRGEGPEVGRKQAEIESEKILPLFTALLFVAHPAQSQAVTYTVQRFTSLATLFYLLAIVLYIQGRLRSKRLGRKELSAGENPDNSWRHALSSMLLYVASLISAVLAMKTKEIAFTLPIIIILAEFVFFGASARKKLLLLLPVLLTLLVIPISIMGTDRPLGETLSDLSEKTRVQSDISRSDYFMTEIRVIVTYIRLLFLPVNQNLDYDYPIYHSFLSPSVFLSALLLISLIGVAVYLLIRSHRAERKAPRAAKAGQQGAKSKEQGIGILSYPACPLPFACYRLIAFGIFWFFITLSVESSFIPIADVIFEHRLYLPSVGAFLAFTAVVFVIAETFAQRWPWTGRAAITALAVAVIALSGVTYARNMVWREDVRLWEDVIGKSPSKARGYVNLGAAYRDRGLIDRAIEQLEKALRLDPKDAEVYYDLGVAYADKGMFDAAIEEYHDAIRLRPAFGPAHYNLGVAYAEKGLIVSAVQEYLTALRLNPDDAATHNNLGSAYGELGRTDEAIEQFRIAVTLQPSYPDAHYNLGVAYKNKGLTSQAMEQFGIADRLRPGNPDDRGGPSRVYGPDTLRR